MKFTPLFILSILLFWGCKNTPTPHTLRVSNAAEPATLDPHLCSGIPCMRVLSTLNEGLVTRGHQNSTLRPGLAKHWKISQDGLIYTFSLRKTTWSDQKEITSHDIVYSWRRFADPKTGSRYSFLLSQVTGFSEITTGNAPPSSLGVYAPNDSTLIVTLKHPQAYFLELCSLEPMFPVPQHSIEKYGKQWTQADHFIGNGAYTLKEWRSHREIKVQANPYYWNIQPEQIKTIRFFPVDNPQTEVAMFKSGQVDWIFDVPPARIRFWKDKKEFVSSNEFGLEMYRFNTKDSLFQNPKVRQALSMAIDRKKLVRYVTKGQQTPAYGLVPPGISWYNPDSLIGFSPVKAKQLLAEAGYTTKNFPPFELAYNQNGHNKKIAEAISQMWFETLGIKATLRNYEWKVMLDALNNLNYSIARSSWIGDYLDPTTFTDLFQSTNGNNRTGFHSALYDSLVLASQQPLPHEQRAVIFQKMENLLLQESPIIPLFYYQNLELRHSRIKNVGQSLTGLYSFKDIRL